MLQSGSLRGVGQAVRAESETVPIAASVDDIDAATSRLLRGYADALRFAARLPLLGRCRAVGEDGRARARWLSRPFTLLYVQSHVRKQVRRAKRSMELELISRDDDGERTRLASLTARLKQDDDGALGWGRLKEIAARLPPITAAIPIVAGAVTAFVQGQAIDAKGLLRAVVFLSIIGFLVWLLFVWPSIRLGFRVKRAIFTGGEDLRHPLLNAPGEATWQHRATQRPLHQEQRLVKWPDGIMYFPDRPWQAVLAKVDPRNWRRSLRAPEEWAPFPTENVYRLEKELFALLRDAKPGELPVDMLFSAPPYVLLSLVVFFWVGMVDATRQGEYGSFVWAIPLTLFVTGLFLRVIVQAIRNHWARSDGPTDWVDLIPLFYKVGEHKLLVGMALHRAADWEEQSVMQQVAMAAQDRPKDFPPALLKEIGLVENVDGEGA
jgi:hypothetical protein